jgi:hypothetical protein
MTQDTHSVWSYKPHDLEDDPGHIVSGPISRMIWKMTQDTHSVWSYKPHDLEDDPGHT